MADDEREAPSRAVWAADAAAQYLALRVTVAEGSADAVPRKDFAAARERMLRDPMARKLAPSFVVRCKTPELLWGYLRTQATESGSWAIRRGVLTASQGATILVCIRAVLHSGQHREAAGGGR